MLCCEGSGGCDGWDRLRGGRESRRMSACEWAVGGRGAVPGGDERNFEIVMGCHYGGFCSSSKFLVCVCAFVP